MKQIKAAAEGTIWKTVQDFERAILSRNSSLDDAFVRACRRLVAEFLIRNESRDINGISIKDAILPSYPQANTMEDYCKIYVDAMGVDAEGLLVDTGKLWNTKLF